MIYAIIKFPVRLALRIFCRRVHILHREGFAARGPLLVIANHPNSFLDAILIGSVFNRPVHFLARGDAFHKPRHKRLLHLLNMIPVYRLRDGRENLVLNEKAFLRSKEILSAGGIVLIFIEGICVHSHDLQPFKKGAARIAMENRNLAGFQILPVGIAYHSFERFGKEVVLDAGTNHNPQELLPYETDTASNLLFFNKRLKQELFRRIHAYPCNNTTDEKSVFASLFSALIRVLHLPLYLPVKKRVRSATTGTVFYDSVLFATLPFLYPFYLLLLGLLLGILLSSKLFFLPMLFFPLLAMLYIRYYH